MNRITIKDVGPIKEIDVELNKVNVLMGPQSSGKSTIAKIISYCQWVEKRYMIDGEYKYNVREQLLDFHRLNENYFSDNSLFIYETDFIHISYKGKELVENIFKKESSGNYKKTKNIYIPSERNFVSVIPNLSKYKETNDNIMSFVYDWFSAKRIFNRSNLLSVLNLGIDYYNNSENDNGVLILKNKKEILLREGSSGLQSVIPLIVIIEYLTNYIYNTNVSNSVEEKDSFRNYFDKKIKEIIETAHSSTVNDLQLSINDLEKILASYQQVRLLEIYNSTNFIIEEPEQNLFPSTQRELVYYLFKKMSDKRNHNLLLTTHSPFILYSINNCMMGFNVRNKENELDFSEIYNKESWINPDYVSIWQVKDGELISVKDKITKTVTKHYFNEVTKDIMDEYFELLSHFEYDTEN